MNDAGRKLGLLGALYVSQAVPMGFFVVALPAILRAGGAPLESVGLVGAVALPWLLKFLWAPWVDGRGADARGHYRSWLLVLQPLTVAVVLALAVVGGATERLPWLLAGGVVFMLAAATQDVATDGLAVRILGRDERGPGNGVQVGGYYFGQVLGGSVLLLAYERFGWPAALAAMALFLALPIVPVVRFRHPEDRSLARTDGALGGFFRRPGILAWLLLVVFYRAGESMAIAMLNPMLIDRGRSLTEIGLLFGVGYSGVSLIGALAGGVSVSRWGRRKALAGFAAGQGVLGLALAALVPAGGTVAPAVAGLALGFVGGLGTASLYTAMMDRCRPEHAATDFTLQQSLAAVGPLVGVGVSGFSAATLGYAGHFALCGALAASVAGVAWRRAAAGQPVPEAVDGSLSAAPADGRG